MKTVLAAVALLGALASSASAADLAARPYTKAAPVAYGYDWSGIYVGGAAGGQWSSIGLSEPTAPAATLAYRVHHDSFIGGVFAGFQKQFGQFVFGVEGGYLTADGSSTTFASASPNIFVPGGAGFGRTSLVDTWNVGGRVGWAFNNWLVYGTGGYAEGGFSFDQLTTAGVIANVANGSSSGYYAGGGVEWAPWRSNVVLGVEYRHYDFGRKLVDQTLAAPLQYDNSSDVVLARASYKFNWPTW